MNQKLHEKVEELEKFSDVTMGRETRVIELKKRINALGKELGKQPEFLGID